MIERLDLPDFTLESKSNITAAFRHLGITQFSEAVEYVRHLPYGRNPHPTPYLGVLTEGKGTCSSKHGLLKVLCQEAGKSSVELCLVFYLMDGRNTPGVGPILKAEGLKAIPEAHCVLQIDDRYIDATNAKSEAMLWRSDVLSIWKIEVMDLTENKVKWHRAYIRDWLESQETSKSFDEVWAIREQCIRALSAIEH